MDNQKITNISYLYGSAAPQLQPQAEPKRKPQAEPLSTRQEEMEKRRRLRERRNLMREKRMSMVNLVIMSIATAMIFGLCAVYIQLQSEVNTRMSRVAELEIQLIALRTDNDIMEKRIETSINFEEIKNRAVNELGMVYPTAEQVIYYHVDKTDYMEQYEDIPNSYEDTIFGTMFH